MLYPLLLGFGFGFMLLFTSYFLFVRKLTSVNSFWLRVFTRAWRWKFSPKFYRSKRHFDDLIMSKGHAACAGHHDCSLARQQIANSYVTISWCRRVSGERDPYNLTLYFKGSNIRNSWQVALIPRVMSAAQWKQISNGLAQCPKALNKFIDDVYKRRKK